MVESKGGRPGKPAEALVSPGRYGLLRRAELALYKIEDGYWKSVASFGTSDLLSIRSGLVDLADTQSAAAMLPLGITVNGILLPLAEGEGTGSRVILSNPKNDALLSCLLFGVQMERWRNGQDLETVEYRSTPDDFTESFKIKKLPVSTAIEGLSVLITEMMIFQRKQIDRYPQDPKPTFGVFMNEFLDRLVAARVNRRIAMKKEKKQNPVVEEERSEGENEEIIDEILQEEDAYSSV